MGLDMYLYDTNKNEIMYWRKASQIHGWFERHSKNKYISNLELVRVTRKQLLELINDCQTALEIAYTGDKERLDKFMPCVHGFFFGSYELDEYYRRQLIQTMDELDTYLKEHKNRVFYYQAWW